MSVVIYAFRSPGSGAVYVGKHECDPTDWPRRGNGRLPDGYPGRGKVVGRFHAKHGDRVQWRILAIVPVADWVRAERRAIHLARLIFGRLCVNVLSGGEGLTSADAKRLWADPQYAAKARAGLASVRLNPELEERRKAAAAKAMKDPDIASRHRAAIAEAAQRPEVIAKNRAQLATIRADPTVWAKNRAAIVASLHDPEVSAKRKAAAAEAVKRPSWVANNRAQLERLRTDPGYIAKNAQQLARLHADPALIAKRKAGLCRAMNDPAVKAKAAATRRRNRARKALAPFRRPPALQSPGVTVWHAPCGSPLGIAGPGRN